MERTREPGMRPGLAPAAGLVAVGVCLAGLAFLADYGTYEARAAVIAGPLLVGVSLPFLARQADRERDHRLFGLLVLALVLKLVGSLARYYVAFDLYGGVADAGRYHDMGVMLAENFRAGNFVTDVQARTGTDFINLLVGVLYTIIGPSLLVGFLVFSWLGFWGLFFFYRAFTIAVPEGRSRSYARLLFLLPSLLFWPSSVGKEAWMIFSLGIVALGAARALSGTTWRGLTVAGLGLWLAALARPHVAGMLALGLGVGYLFLRPRRDLGSFTRVTKLAGIAAVAVLSLILIVRTEEFLGQEDILTPSGLVSELEEVSRRSDYGGSQFTSIIVRSPTQVPLAFVTVLFRPFVTEANNAQAMVAAGEATFLLLLTLARVRWIWAAVRSTRRQPYVAFAAVYTGLFVIAFASFPNFGLLARERVQVLPLYFVLLSIPVVRRRRESEAEPSMGWSPRADVPGPAS